MPSRGDSETEILLGNKHLLAIFFVIAILLGVAITGGYMVGRNSSEKRPVTASAAAPDVAAAQSSPSSLETHSVPAATAPFAETPSAEPAAPHKADAHV